MGILNVNAGLSGSMTQSLNTISNVNRLANDSIARINSGLKFNHISDAPAQILKAQDLQSDIESNTKGIDNNNYVLGQFDGIMTAQDQITSHLTDMASIMDSYTNETDANAKSVLAEEYKALALGAQSIAENSKFDDHAVLDGGFTSSQKAFGTGGSFDVVFTDSSLTGLSLSGTGDITADDATKLTAAITAMGKNSATISGNRKVFESANSIMASSNTGWSQSYNDLIKVNDAEESALLTSLSNQAAAANAAMSYQSQFYGISSGSSFMA